MSDDRPIPGLPEPPGAEPISPPGWVGAPPAPPVRPELRPLRGLAAATMCLVAAVALLNLASIPNDLAYIGSLQELAGGEFSTIPEIEDQEDLRGAFATVTLAATAVAAVVWVLWQQRGRRNATALGASGQRHGTVLAALGWVIPFANLVIPKQVTDDLWRASDPGAPPVLHVEGRPVAGFVHLWWAVWILGGLLGRFLFQTDPPQDITEIDGLITNVRLEIFSQVLVVVGAVLAAMVVSGITDRLAQRATNAGTPAP